MHQKMKSLEISKMKIPYFEGNLPPKKGKLIYINHIFGEKVFGGQHIPNSNLNEISFSEILND